MLTADNPGGSMPLSEGCCGSKVLWSVSSVEVANGNPCSKDTRVIEFLETVEAPENGYIGIKACYPQKAEMSSPTEVHLHQCIQHGHQAGGAGSHCAVGKQLPTCHHGDVVE